MEDSFGGMFKLIGSNYPVWKLKMRDMLVCKDLWLPIQFRNKRLDKIDASTWEVTHRKATTPSRFTIFLCMSADYFSVSSCPLLFVGSVIIGGSIAFGCRSIRSGHHYPIVLHPFTKAGQVVLFSVVLRSSGHCSSALQCCCSSSIFRRCPTATTPAAFRPSVFGRRLSLSLSPAPLSSLLSLCGVSIVYPGLSFQPPLQYSDL